MPTTVDLQRMLRYSALPLAIVSFALLLSVLILIALIIARIVKNRREGRKNTVRSVLWTRPDIEKLKLEYLAKLMDVQLRFDSDNSMIRPAYEMMSVLVREFAYKATGTDVLKYTLSEIKNTDLHELADVIEEFYEPEFDKISAGDVKASIEKTRRVISQWN